MNKKKFKWAYEGGNSLELGIDLIEKYSDKNFFTQKFENYLQDERLSVSSVESALQDFRVDVVGDVVLSGSQNDMRYFCMDTYRDFDGLVSGFGNSRIALICGHYIHTGEYRSTGKYRSSLGWKYNESVGCGDLQEIWKSTGTIESVTLVTGNYYNEPLIQSDVNLICYILKALEEIIGGKLGVCLPREKYNEPMKLISIYDFSNKYKIGGFSYRSL
jgi:hypothetical protein